MKIQHTGLEALSLEQRHSLELECQKVIQQFYFYLDEKRYPDLADLFAAEGAWVRLGKELVGPAGILSAMQERDSWLTMHVVTNLIVRLVSPDMAETTQYVTLYRQEGYDPASGPGPVVMPLGLLRHADTLVHRQGQWKFLRKASRAVMVNRERVTHYDKPNGA